MFRHFNRFLQEPFFLFQLLLCTLLHYLVQLRTFALPVFDLLHPHHYFKLAHGWPLSPGSSQPLPLLVPLKLLFFLLKRLELTSELVVLVLQLSILSFYAVFSPTHRCQVLLKLLNFTHGSLECHVVGLHLLLLVYSEPSIGLQSDPFARLALSEFLTRLLLQHRGRAPRLRERGLLSDGRSH